MTILDLLEKGHQLLISLLEKLKKSQETASQETKALLTEFQQFLSLHNTAEEKLVYPELSKSVKNSPLIPKSYEAHHAVQVLLDELLKLTPSDERWLAKLLIIEENLTNHIEEEEELTFTAIQGAFPEPLLLALAEQVVQARHQQ